MRKQEKYDKEKMARVAGKYKNEFVSRFKTACEKLNVTQSEIIRKGMEETIMKAENLEFVLVLEEIAMRGKRDPESGRYSSFENLGNLDEYPCTNDGIKRCIKDYYHERVNDEYGVCISFHSKKDDERTGIDTLCIRCEAYCDDVDVESITENINSWKRIVFSMQD